jgi:hypothetical protein
MTGEPKANQSPSGASKTRYLACIVEHFICSTLSNSYTNYNKIPIFEKKNRMSFTYCFGNARHSYEHGCKILLTSQLRDIFKANTVTCKTDVYKCGTNKFCILYFNTFILTTHLLTSFFHIHASFHF